MPDDMVRLEPGSFQMGSLPGEGDSDETLHQVTLTKAFLLDKTEVTAGAYEACVKAGKCAASTTTWSGGQGHPELDQYCTYGKTDLRQHPMNCVDWDNARKYCAFVGKQLPTEAQWEYAARGDGRKYVWGNDWPPPARSGNFCDEQYKRAHPGWEAIAGYDDGYAVTAPVGQFPADWRQLLDMAGNVWEWVEDAYAPYGAQPVVDPIVKNSEDRVVRGGSWDFDDASYLRAANRNRGVPANRYNGVGFRCARTL